MVVHFSVVIYTRRRRRQTDQLRYRDEKIARLEKEIANLHLITTSQPTFNCHYPAQMMALAIFIVLHGGSLRCAAATTGFYAELMGWKYSAPSFKIVSNSVERCGLHALGLTKSLTGEYVAIFDASIQIGKEQLLLLLYVKAELAARLDRPLTIADVVVLGMEVQSSWLGGEVKAFVNRCLADRPGLNLIYAVCDQGTNLKAALRGLALPNVSDCSHVMMNLVKKIFKDDIELSTLCASVGQLRRRLTLTDYAFALPATLRDKGRFGRIFTLIDWMDRIDSCRNGLPTDLVLLLDEGRKRWLDVRLRQVHHLLVLTSKILKYDGLSQAAYDKWVQEIIDYLGSQSQVTRQAKTFINGMIYYFNRQATLYAGDQKLLCCSDIIESIFGRYKNKGGMKAISADVLSIALYNQPISVTFVQTAMPTVTGPQLDDWRCQNVCHNRYGIRRKMERELRENAGG